MNPLNTHWEPDVLEAGARHRAKQHRDHVARLEHNLWKRWDEFTPDIRKRTDLMIRRLLQQAKDAEADIQWIGLEYNKPVHKNKKRFEQDKRNAYSRLISYTDEMLLPKERLLAGF